MPHKRMLIVDGYNVIRNNARYSELGCDFESSHTWNTARETLINDAATMAGEDYDNCAVVFDGAGNPNSTGKPEHRANIDVIFSSAGVSADTVIERLAHDYRVQGYEVVVVSSDYAIQSTVFGGGVTRMSALAFAYESEESDEDWKRQQKMSNDKNTLASRLDKSTRAKLEALLFDEV